MTEPFAGQRKSLALLALYPELSRPEIGRMTVGEARGEIEPRMHEVCEQTSMTYARRLALVGGTRFFHIRPLELRAILRDLQPRERQQAANRLAEDAYITAVVTVLNADRDSVVGEAFDSVNEDIRAFLIFALGDDEQTRTQAEAHIYELMTEMYRQLISVKLEGAT